MLQSHNVDERDIKILDLPLYPDQHEKLMGSIWAETHPPFKFCGNHFRSLCGILLIIRPTNEHTQRDS